jgi:hypothetical protein
LEKRGELEGLLREAKAIVDEWHKFIDVLEKVLL